MGTQTNHSSTSKADLNRSGTLRRGGVHSIYASVLGSFLFLCIYLLFSMVTSAELASEDLLTDRQGYLILFFIFYCMLGLLATFLVALIPGLVGGWSIALILRSLSSSGTLTLLRGILVGILVGGLFGYLTAQVGAQLMINLVIDVYSIEEEAQAIREIVASGLLAAVIAGAWHGWKMTQSLKNEM